jgi:2'-5' RNA ligase
MVGPRPDHMRDHWWWRPGWRVGRRFYTWHITFEGQDDLHRLVRAYQSHLDVPELDLVPLEGLHLTMQGVGFTDEVSQQDLQEIVIAAGARCAPLAPFTLTLGPARVRPEGVNLPVAPEAPVRQLRMAIREAIAAVWGEARVPEPTEGFRPHVTMAYSNADGLAAPIVERVGRVGALQAVAPIRAAQLIDLERDTHVYRWKTQAAVPLLGEA